jgi:methyl coenzyme M reductase beta subunit
LDGLNLYIDKVNKDVVGAATIDRLEVVKLLETKGNVWTESLDAGRVTDFVNYAKSVDDDIDNIASTFESYKTLIAKLKEGHSTLVKTPHDDINANDILTAATNILTALTQVQTAVAGKSSSN